MPQHLTQYLAYRKPLRFKRLKEGKRTSVSYRCHKPSGLKHNLIILQFCISGVHRQSLWANIEAPLEVHSFLDAQGENHCPPFLAARGDQCCLSCGPLSIFTASDRASLWPCFRCRLPPGLASSSLKGPCDYVLPTWMIQGDRSALLLSAPSIPVST